MTSVFFEYNKPKVIQALRYHFISRKEIKMMIILVNVFAIFSAALYYFKKISPAAFLMSSMLWFVLMILFWFLLPLFIYRKTKLFRSQFRVSIADEYFMLEHETDTKRYRWSDFSIWIESPHFFHLYFNPTSFFLIPKDAFDRELEGMARKMFSEKIKS